MRILRATNRNIEYLCMPEHIFAILYEDLYIKNVACLSCEMAENAPGPQNAPNAHVCLLFLDIRQHSQIRNAEDSLLDDKPS